MFKWFKKLIYKFFPSDIKRNVKNSIFVFSILPIFLTFILAYFLISKNQWETILSDINTKVHRSVNAINMDLTNAIQISNSIAYNPFIVNGLTENYDNKLEKNMEFYQILDFYFSSFKYTLPTDEELVVIYHNNPSLYSSRYSNFLNEPNDVLKGLNLNDNNLYWDVSKNKISIYRKFENIGSFNGILRLTVPNNSTKTVTEHITNNLDENLNVTYELSDNLVYNTKVFHQISGNLINGNYYRALVPLKIKMQIYFKNFLILSFALAFIILFILTISNVISKTITGKIENFIATIKKQVSLSDCEDLSIDEFDEYAPIYIKIKNLITQINETHKELDKSNSEKVALELAFIQTKINPHLLYNSLSALRWKALDLKNYEYAEIIQSLIAYYRDILGSGKNIVTLSQEIELVKKYIKVMEFIHMHSYPCNIQFEDNLMECLTVKHILQPFVENAILHGINRKPDGNITIIGSSEDKIVTIKIIDNGFGIKEEVLKEINNLGSEMGFKNFGINNTRRRIKLFYGESSYVSVESIIGKGTCVSISFKMQENES